VCTVALCYIHSLLFGLDSLEVIRLINDQTCPYFQYRPIEQRGSRIDDIVVDDKYPRQYTCEDMCNHIKYDGPFYEYKPYE
jgi:hypothetical protein